MKAKKQTKKKLHVIYVTEEQLNILVDALDSHGYWQLSDPRYRNSGFVMAPGSDDPICRKELKKVDALHDELEKKIIELGCNREPHFSVR